MILFTLMALGIGTLLTACSGGKPSASIPEEAMTPAPTFEDIVLVKDGVTDYVIVRPEVDKYDEMSSAMFLYSYLKSCGVTSQITTDWKGNGTQAHEIVIGHSDRLKDTDPSHYLGTAEILYAMAIAYDWLYVYWTPQRREVMEAATLKFGLNTGLDCYEGRAGIWGTNNWTGVCNGGLVSAALAYSSVYPDECTRILGYALGDLERGLYSYAPDGGYLESPSYWAYGTNYSMILISSLESATGRDYGLFNSPGFAASACFLAYMETEVGSWGYHDSGSGQHETMTLSWLAKKIGDGSLNRLRRNSIDANLKPVHAIDLMFYDPQNITDTVDLSLDACYRQVGSVTMRSSWDNGAIFVGLHGGSNSVSHGDPDIGNFVLDAAGTRFFTDLGFDDYNIPGYFSDLRWTYYRKRAEGQNTLVMGDVSYQMPDQITDAVARFERVESSDSTGIAILDTTPAYAKLVSITSGKRGLLFTDDCSTVIIQDEVHLSKATTVCWGCKHTRQDHDQ